MKIITPNVAKSNTELMGPKRIMNLRMKPMSQWAGRLTISGSTRSVGIEISLESYSRLSSRICVADIGRNGRKREAPAALNMLPKFEDVPISTYLIVLEKI